MKYAVIGAGITGLMAAKAILDKDSDAHVTIIERDQVVGGLLAGIEYSEQELYFDLGTHIFQETGIDEIDNNLLSAIPPKDLIHFLLTILSYYFNSKKVPHSLHKTSSIGKLGLP